MTSLQPHIMLISREVERSPAAVSLRSGGYAVTKVNEDGLAFRLLEGGRIDAVVLELTVLNAIAYAKRLREAARDMPILVVTGFSQTVLRSTDVAAISPVDVEEEIVRNVDRLLADRELNLHRVRHG